MTDDELLEAAGKAAGIELAPTGYVWDDAKAEMVPWNPLTDDGDAFRLAVALRLEVMPLEGGGVDVQRTTESEPFGVLLATECGADPYAATRRAIVRAAAALKDTA